MPPMTASLWADRGRKRAEKMGIDPSRLPPGQSPTEKFPILTIGRTPHVDVASWTFAVHGEVEEPLELRWEEFQAEPQVEVVTDIHCVTRWSKFDTRWRGVRVRDLIERARPRPTATHALVHAEGGYTTNLPLEALLDDDVLIAHEFGGEPLEPDHGGPARLVVPSRYFWKSAKWVRSIELLDRDVPGIWERNGYHNDADPWREERHSAEPTAVRLMRRALRGTKDPT